MPSWKGDPKNPAPKIVREPIDRSEKPIGDNRAAHVRRDKDNQRNFTIGLYDIDETVMTHMARMPLELTDQGQVIKVPYFYGSPEMWTSVRRDGYLRDKQGKVILPLIVLKRVSSANDETLQYFNRYLKTSVLKKYSTKNKYTQFSALVGQNSPVNEVYNIVFPSHMLLTYHFILWTEYIEQMNKLVETFQFNTKDYWGNPDGFRFRTRIENYTHTTEIQIGEDRIVKTEFDLTLHGYILPETITTLETQKLTFEKFFTPKKFIVNTEVVATDKNIDEIEKNREKWRNPDYPNLPKDEIIPGPGIAVVDEGQHNDEAIASKIVTSLKSSTASPQTIVINESVPNSTSYLRVVSPPPDLGSGGSNGDIAFDDQYFYIYVEDRWRRVAISQFQ